MDLTPLENQLLCFGIAYMIGINVFVKSMIIKRVYQKEKLDNSKMGKIDWAALCLVVPLSFLMDALPFLFFFYSPYAALGLFLYFLFRTIYKTRKNNGDVAGELRLFTASQVPLFVAFALLVIY